ncbi:hypothetical protein EXN68_27250 [Rhizobium rhizogenes]|uniref:Uncharacterized protein n=1 Tax=Rhizobium rhizogenes TaxID=359 RepID=A0A546WYU4_RHIRH|nr:hypothetical protein EXN68_27250 [Rhizobium rhizogenes]
MGFYEMYVLAARADTVLMRRRVTKIMNHRLKRRYLHNQRKKSDFETEAKRGAHLRPGRIL